ncbi:MAG: hypothetical protein KAH03_06265 [Cocleimonas sp.]|nr:hypothetical protein [Cocleimonas sp.]
MFFGSNECDRVFVVAGDIDEQIAAIERTYLIAGAIELGDSAQLLSNMQKETGYNFPSLRRSLNIKSNESEKSMTVTHEVVAYDKYTIDNNEYYSVDREGKNITTFINGKAKRYRNAWDVKKANGYHTAFQKSGQLVRRIWGPAIGKKLFKSAEEGRLSPRIFNSAVGFLLTLNLVLKCNNARHKSMAVIFAEAYYRLWLDKYRFGPSLEGKRSGVASVVNQRSYKPLFKNTGKKVIGAIFSDETHYVQKLDFPT